MTEPDGTPALVAAAEAEQQSESSACGDVQDGIPVNVCLRDTGHDGPHVGKPADEFLQWEG